MIATTGFFDGVHLGHRAVLRRVLEMARLQGKESAVITFWPHPRVILHYEAEKVRLLNALDEKKKLLYEAGINHVWVIPFTSELASYSPEQFFRDYLLQQFRVSDLVVGYDHHLGNNAGADCETMKEIGASMGIAVEQIPAVNAGEAGSHHPNSISSTKIREALQVGDISFANACLGYLYMLQGVVVEGDKIGRTIGFPTVNLQLYEPLKQVPAGGVYAVQVAHAGKAYRGMMNIGVRPTIKKSPVRTIETHIFDFDEDVYGQSVEIRVVARIRDEQQFSSIEALKTQLATDKQKCGSIKM